MRFVVRLIVRLVVVTVMLVVIGAAVILSGLWHFGRGLPDYEQLAHYEPPVLTRVHAGDGRVLAEFATERRLFVPVDAMPKLVVRAFLAAEDKSFYQHPGISLPDIARAAVQNLMQRASGAARRPVGASTITQQVAKNFLLTNEVTLERKAKEAILALRIERALSKDRILELYLNEIYLGGGNYGVAQAALNYFDRSLDELSLAEIAYLAALPKAPNRYHLVRHEKEAYGRRDYVLNRMLEDGYITQAEVAAAKAERLTLRRRSNTETVTADFFAEEVRRNLMAAYGEKGLYEGGLTVRTTLNPEIQAVADEALRQGLIDYDRRHGWRGPHAKIADMNEGWQEEFARIAQRRPLFGPPSWQLAVVTKVDPQSVTIGGLPNNEEGTIPFAEMQWARPTLPEQRVGPPPARPAAVVERGDVIAVERIEKPAGQNAKPYPPNTYALRQMPNVEGGVVVMDPRTGRVLALAGGWSYGRSQFNRAVQAQRQPGSAFKPFVYLAAMDAGFTPASIVLDAPFSYDPGYGQPIWTPRNYGGDYLGPTSIRRGLELSRNLMTVRMAQQIGMRKVVDVAKKFGVTDQMGAYLPMSLGAGETTLLRMTMAYAMLANGAQEITPSLVDRVQDRNGKTIYRHEPRVCRGCGEANGGDKARPPEIVDPRQPFHDPATVYQVVHMMLGVTTRGTAARLAALGRPIAGKTGTTNDAKDNWFIGSTPDLTIGIYIGFDEPRTLGPGNLETGGGNAAPIYEQIAKVVFKDKPPTPFRIPPGLRMVRTSYEGGAIDELFKPGTEPGSEGAMRPLDGSAPLAGMDPSGAGGRRPAMSGTGETY